MYDWNKDGKIDTVDHWISNQIINYEKERRENGSGYSSGYHYTEPQQNNNEKKKGPSLMAIVLIDIALFSLICMMNSCGM